MNTIFKSSKLDEMQEIQMLKIEHYGLWLAFWGMLVITIVQASMGAPFQQYAAEGFLLCGLAVFELVADLRYGLWDRTGKPSLGLNLLAALAAAAITGGSTFVGQGYLPGSLLSGGCSFLLTFGLLQLWASLYRKRRAKLDHVEEDSTPNEEDNSHE